MTQYDDFMTFILMEMTQYDDFKLDFLVRNDHNYFSLGCQ